MTEFLSVLFGLIAAIGVYFVYRQYSKSKPNLVLLDIHASPKLLPPESEKYSYRFVLTFENRRDHEYAVNEIYWTIWDRTLIKQILHEVHNGWWQLDIENQPKADWSNYRKPLIIGPYERQEVTCFLAKLDTQKDERFYRLLKHLIDRRYSIRIFFGDGRKQTYRMTPQGFKESRRW